MGRLPTTMPDQHPERRGGVLKRTLQTYLESIADPSPTDVVRGLTETVQPGTEYRCLNPVCDQMCAWPSGYAAGRPTRFCSRRCRQMFDGVRARLSWELETLEDWLGHDDLLAKDRVALQRAAGQRRWALERYPRSPEAAGDRATS